MGIVLDCSFAEEAKLHKKSYIKIAGLSVFPELIHGFTTRYGGVSTGDYATFNLSFNRPDLKSNVEENYRILAKELGTSIENMVLSQQVHDNKIFSVSKKHAGMGLSKEFSYSCVDGIATKEENLMLITHYADCVPLFLYDPIKKIIALTHSGWRGTLLDIGGETVKVLKDTYDCNPEDLYLAFGPHIRACCFEVDEDVTIQFKNTFPWSEEYFTDKDNGKYTIDLEAIIIQNILKQNILVEHINKCNICTCCNKDVFFSHRGSGGKTGTGAAFMMIRG